MKPPPDVPSARSRYRRIGLGALIVAWGAQAIVTQSLLLREAMVLMFGSEFAWGIVLFAWLLGVAVGAAIGGWAATRLSRADVALAVVLLILSVAACVELWIFRGARAWLGVRTGELLPLVPTAAAAILLVSPVSALVGMAFPLACRLAETHREDEPTIARLDPGPVEPAGVGPLGTVYALESAGSLVGGAAFSFWAVEHFSPIQTALVCGAITIAASAAMLIGTLRNPRRATGLIPISAALLLAAVLGGRTLNDRLVNRRWRNVAPGYKLCAEVESKYQNLAIGRLAEQFTLYCDGQVSVDFPDPYTFGPLAHFWMCQHPAPHRVLVLGGGAEGLLSEILRHPVEHVDYVEPDPRQIALVEPYLADVDRRALHDPRITVHYLDARYFIKTQQNRFDLVIARLPEPTSALRARYYTAEFYGELRRAMTPRSVLCTMVTAAPGELSAISGEYLASVRATLRTHFPHVTVGWGDPAHILAATEAGLVSIHPAELTKRYLERGVTSDLFHPAWFEGATDWLDPQKVQRRAEELDAVRHVQVSTDLRPFVYVQRLVLWDRMTGGRSGTVIERLRNVGWLELIGGLVAAAGVTALWSYLRCRIRKSSEPTRHRQWASSAAVVWSVGTTGFATMALSIVWLFAFQNLYGYVYQRIGWIIAVFMGGLVIGCGIAARRSRRIAEGGRLSRYLWQRMIALDVLLAALAFAVPVILPAFGAIQGTRVAFVLVEWGVSILVALTGMLGGATFALAGGLRLAATGRAATAAGSVIGADHAGACAGALLTGVLLVPVFGTTAAAFFLAGIKLTSAGLLLAGWRWSQRA